MDIPVSLGQDVKADIKISGGKLLITLEVDGADAALDALKPHLPTWLQPVIDIAKKAIDAA